MAVPIMLAAAPAISSLIQGFRQRRQRKKLKPDPIPTAIRMAKENAERMANQTQAPGQSLAASIMREGTAASIDNAAQASTSAANILNAGAAADAREKGAMLRLQGQNLQYQNANQANLTGARAAYGQAQQIQQDRYNAAKAGLRNASDNNFYNAITQGAKTALAGIGIDQAGALQGGPQTVTSMPPSVTGMGAQGFSQHAKSLIKRRPYVGMPNIYTDSGYYPGIPT